MVETIFQYGEDALNNEASISIDVSALGVQALKDIIGEDELKFRATGFSVPQKSILTYDQPYKGFTIQRWKAGTDLDRQETITFRLDKYWRVYRFFRTWMEAISNLEGTGEYYPDSSDNSILRTSMTIQQTANTLDANGNTSETIIAPGWVFTGVWPRSIAEVSFDNTDEGSAQTVDVTFGFINVRQGDDA